MSVDNEDTTFACIVGGVCKINQTTTVNSRGFNGLAKKNVLKIIKNRQREGPVVRCRLIKIIAYML